MTGKPAGTRIFHAFARLLGPRLFEAFVRWGLVSLLLRMRRKPMRAVLRRILTYQEKPASEEVIDRLVSSTGDRYARNIVSFSLMGRLAPRLGELVELQLLPVVEKLRRSGKGVILVTPHFGDLHLGIAALAVTGLPITALMLGAQNLGWAQTRTLRYLPIGSSAAGLIRALQANELVLVFGDLDFFQSGRTAEFFGAPYSPPDGAVRLALASQSPLLPIYVIGSEEGRHRVWADEPVFVEPGSTQEELEGRLLRSMEGVIGRHPDQWMIFMDPWDIEGSRRYARTQLGLAPRPR